MPNILSKTELYNKILLNFPDNASQQITAESMRDFLDDFVASNLIQQPVSVTAPNYVMPEEIDTILLEVGADTVFLPDIGLHKDRFLFIGNASGETVLFKPDGTDTIDGKTELNILNGTVGILSPFDALGVSGDWQVVSNTRDKITINVFVEDNSTETVIVTQGVYEDMNISLSEIDPSPFFAVSGNTVMYIGDIPISAEINESATVASDGNDKTVAIKIIKNKDTVDEEFLDGRSCFNSHPDKYNAGSLFTKTTLIKDDVLHFVVTNTENNDEVTILDLTSNIKEE